MIRTRSTTAVAALAFATISCRDAAAPAFTPSYDLLYESTATPQLNQPSLFMLPEGGSQRISLIGETQYAAQPRVSFDGRWVAYIAPRAEDGEGAVWLARTDGTAARQVFTTSGELLSRPAPSPDGSRVAFQATDDATGSSMIWIVNANGSGARAITTEPHAAPYVHTAPAWSPDGTQLALAAGAPGSLRIATMPAQGGPLTVRTQATSGSDTEPSWSPDGTRLVFAHTTTSAQSELVILTLAGGTRQTLYSGNAHDPAWSPAGRLIAFSNRASGEPSELFTMPATGGTPVRITTNQLTDRHPNWVVRPVID